jgi:exodeoxyribonuclease VII large subunit
VTGSDPVFSVSDFVDIFNQTLEFAYPSVMIVGELANFRVSKNRWVYFDLKDELSSVKFFGTVYQLPGPLEDGLTIQVRGTPRLHNLYGFSVNVESMSPVGEGSIKKAASLLETKLAAEGLFDPARKRALPYPPETIGLITSSESAAYHDFIKILGERWGGIDIRLADVQVQGEAAAAQIVTAIKYFNQHSVPPEVLVITRGGGGADDLSVFSTEQVTRAVAASRIPTVVAIGHEVDISLAELAADMRASTPSNAAELMTPSKSTVRAELTQISRTLTFSVNGLLAYQTENIQLKLRKMGDTLHNILVQFDDRLESRAGLLNALSPGAVLKRGYAVVRLNGRALKTGKAINTPAELEIELIDAVISAKTSGLRLK